MVKMFIGSDQIKVLNTIIGINYNRHFFIEFRRSFKWIYSRLNAKRPLKFRIRVLESLRCLLFDKIIWKLLSQRQVLSEFTTIKLTGALAGLAFASLAPFPTPSHFSALISSSFHSAHRVSFCFLGSVTADALAAL